MLDTPSLARPPRPAWPRAGQVLLGALFWLIAIAVLALPFLRSPDAPDWGRPDPTRNPETDIPFLEDVAEFDLVAAEEDFGLDGTLAELVDGASERYFARDSEWLAASDILRVEQLASGERVYLRNCAGCHGLDGDGAGPAARYLVPRPRNFRHGTFKFTSTDNGMRPLRSDLMQVVTRGLAGSSMPEHRLLPDELRSDVVEYVRYLSMRGEFEQMLLDYAWSEERLPDPEESAEIVRARWDEVRMRAVYPTTLEPPRDEASIARGRELFREAERATCFTCHGNTGRGDGTTADAYDDQWGYPIRPRNFAEGVFRAGESGKDLWVSIATGINGSPMGAFLGPLDGEEIWQLVHYVQFVAEGGDAEESSR